MFGLGVNRLGATNQKPFSPASLFNKGEAGVWYDPSAASGSLDWRKNLLEYTEQFNNDYWQKLRGDVTPFESPIGDTSAFKFQQFSGQTIVPVIRANVPVITGKVYTFSAFVKKGTRDSFSLHEQATTTGIDSYFNILNGTVSFQGSGHIARIQDAGNGWYRCSITYTAAFSASKKHDLRIGVAETTAVPDDQGFTYLWGAQLEEASTASSYQPILGTFESAFKTAFPSHTLYQDYQGTTPVTAVGEPVGLMLDKSEGLAQGPELVTNGTFDTNYVGWTPFSIGSGSPTYTVDNQKLKVNINGSYDVGVDQSFSTVAGRFYAFSLDVDIVTAFNYSQLIGAFIGTGAGSTQSLNANFSSGSHSFIIQATSSTTHLRIRSVSGSNTQGVYTVDNVSVTEIQGSHATQPTSTKRPIYARHPEGGIRNLLNYTEQLDNDYWSKNADIITPNAAIAPDGTQTADKFVAANNNSTHEFNFGNNFGTSVFVQSIHAKAGEYSFLFINGVASGDFTFFNLSNGTIGSVSSQHSNVTMTPAGDGWYRCSITVTGANAGTGFGASNVNGLYNYQGNGIDGIYMWGAQLEVATEASNYQKRVTDIDVTESGVGEVYYLKFDGVDDQMFINNLTSPNTPITALFGYSATNAATGGFRYLLDIQYGRTLFAAQADLEGQIGYFDGEWSSFNADANAIKVLTYDLLENDAKIRIDGTQEYSDTTYDQQAIGGAMKLFNVFNDTTRNLAGNMYQTILRAAESTDEEIAKAETYVANKTGLKAQVDGIATLDLNFGNNIYTAKNSNGGVI